MTFYVIKSLSQVVWHSGTYQLPFIFSLKKFELSPQRQLADCFEKYLRTILKIIF